MTVSTKGSRGVRKVTTTRLCGALRGGQLGMLMHHRSTFQTQHWVEPELVSS